LAGGSEREEFWSRRSLEELAQAQGVGAVESVAELQDDTISDEEAEAFIAALGLGSEPLADRDDRIG
jgi:hypothetical protein